MKQDVTFASSVASTLEIAQPTRLSPDTLANSSGALRTDVAMLSKNVARVHNDFLQFQLDTRTDDIARRSPQESLHELSELGFAWTAISRLVGVSVPAIRKWRQGENVSGEKRRDLARLVAFTRLLRDDALITDVASWLEMPLADSAFNGIDVFVTGELSFLLEFAHGHIAASVLLDRCIANWQSGQDSGFESFRTGDGQKAIRMREI
jgi:hypothetical protein